MSFRNPSRFCKPKIKLDDDKSDFGSWRPPGAAVGDILFGYPHYASLTRVAHFGLELCFTGGPVRKKGGVQSGYGKAQKTYRHRPVMLLVDQDVLYNRLLVVAE